MEKISVAVRFRPPTSLSNEASDDRIWKIDGNRISLHRSHGTPINGTSFTFDHVFDWSSTNSMIYSQLTKPIIQAAINGFNGTAFAYGQTSSGKTYTMNGSEYDPGIIHLAVKDIFQSTQMITDREFLIRFSYMEIYNEEINDLLSLGNQKLPIHESLERGIFVAGLREEIVNSAEQVNELLKLGEENRHFGETNMNARSSRSHSIFRMVIESRAKDSMSLVDDLSADAIRVSILNLVDLAGSERIAKTGAGGVRLKEGKYINKSLMILGNVINKLSEGGRQRAHIPYRDSKLTRILQPALGGNAKTSIICTLAPEEIHIEETRGTLQFASRAKRVTNCAQVNEILTDAALLKRQKLEIEELRQKLQGQHSEVLEQVILKQRNDMHKSELECEKLAMELEEERKLRENLEMRLKEQQLKFESLSKYTASEDLKNRTSQDTGYSESNFHELSNGNRSMNGGDFFQTPNFRAAPVDFVAKRTSFSRELNLSPVPDNFDSVADEDLWLQLNKGCTTNIDMLQMTPDFNCTSIFSADTRKERNTRRYGSLGSNCSMNMSQPDTDAQHTALEKECGMLREENETLSQALTLSKQNFDALKGEKEELEKILLVEKQKMADLKEELKMFSIAFTQRECLLTSLFTKSKALVENLI